MTKIRQGLDLPILGSPEQHIDQASAVSRVALLGDDYVGMKPTMLVAPGDKVSVGQPLFEDKKNPGVLYTSPAAGTIAAVNRGAKRKFESVEIDVDGDESVQFEGAAGRDPMDLGREALTEQLRLSGLWPSLRTRPYGKVPMLGSQPSSIFVQAVDTNPLAADHIAMADRKEQFALGLVPDSTGGRRIVARAMVQRSLARVSMASNWPLSAVHTRPGWLEPTSTSSILLVPTRPCGTSVIRMCVQLALFSRLANLTPAGSSRLGAQWSRNRACWKHGWVPVSTN